MTHAPVADEEDVSLVVGAERSVSPVDVSGGVATSRDAVEDADTDSLVGRERPHTLTREEGNKTTIQMRTCSVPVQ